jgi:hypothetical protein
VAVGFSPAHRLAKAWLGGLLLLGAAVAGVLAADKVPRFEPAQCWFATTAGERIACGYLVVPENREAQGGRAIRLAMAVLQPSGAAPPDDPVVVVGGGPGGSVGLTEEGMHKWRSMRSHMPGWQRRDVILLEERGAGPPCPASTATRSTATDSSS